MNNQTFINSQELDKIFDRGEEDIIEYLDFSTGRRPGSEFYSDSLESLPRKKYRVEVLSSLSPE